MKKLETTAITLLFIYLLVTFGYIFTLGFYSTAGIFLLTAAAIFLIVLSKRRMLGFVQHNFTLGAVASLILIVSTSLSVAMYGGIYQTGSDFLIQINRTLLIIGLVVSLLYFFDFSIWLPLLGKYKFLVLVFIAAISRLFLILTSPNPHIDVFYIQKIAPIAMIHGENPYSIIFPRLYSNIEPNAFTYGPGAILLNFPAVFITGDPRFTMAFAEIATAMLIYLMIRKTVKFSNQEYFKLAELIPLIYLYNPRASFIIEQAWIDPLLIFLITSFIFFFFYLKKRFFAILMLALALATKQYAFFLLPFLFQIRTVEVKHILGVVMLVILLVAPFFIWSPNDFINDVVLYNLVIIPRHDSLSLNTLVYKLFNIDIPPLIVGLVVFSLLVFLFKVQKKTVSEAILATAAFALSFFLVYKLAFIHYFYFVGSLLLLSIVLLIDESSVSIKPSNTQKNED